jgi:putative N6-adenine-specific DNA methylase
MKETFFLQVPPGLENLAKQEFELKYPILAPETPVPQVMVEKGGIIIELPLEKGFALNYWLKIPNRVLLRFAHFKCRDIPKLFNKVSKLKWAPYFAGQKFQIHSSSHESRLFDDRKIVKAIEDALEKNFKASEPKARAKKRVRYFKDWNLYCRFEDDWCTLSLDTSGERLGLRGYKVANGMAPLRENIAAALYLYMLFHFGEETRPSGELTPSTLVDPFCGSGTLLTEAALFFEPNLYRNYAFEFFPLNEDKKAAGEPQLRPASLNLDIPLFLIGIDKSEERVNEVKENLKSAGINLADSAFLSSDSLTKTFPLKMNCDVFSDPNNEVWCLTNPPYGKRVKTSAKLMDVLKSLSQWGKWEKIGILLPPQKIGDLEALGLKQSGSLDFENGGEKVRFLLLESKRLD